MYVKKIPYLQDWVQTSQFQQTVFLIMPAKEILIIHSQSFLVKVTVSELLIVHSERNYRTVFDSSYLGILILDIIALIDTERNQCQILD